MKNKRGFTLVEVMVTVGLFSVVLMGLYVVLVSGNILYNNDTSLLDMEGQCRNAVERIVKEVRQSSSHVITANYNGTTNDKIMFCVPSITSCSSSTGIQYYLTNTDLVREYPSGTSVTIASNISRLNFSIVGSLLTIRATASEVGYKGTVTYPLTENVRLRNE
jgi:prepilin-type N-terminal cleavage/methylation domain-containing protein